MDRQFGTYFVNLLITSKFDNFTWRLVVVYGDAQQDGKAKFLIELVHIIRSSHCPILIAGDFNLTRRASDKNKPGGYNRWSPLFNAVIEQGGLMELSLSGRKYTWCNNHEDPTYELLDRVLVSHEWEEHFPLVCVSTPPSELSDHSPLLIKAGSKPTVPASFRFENCWFQRPDLGKIVEDVWKANYVGDTNIDRWQERFRKLRRTLKGWDRNVQGQYKKNRKILAEHLDTLDRKGEELGLTAQDRAEQKNFQMQLRKMIREEEVKWMQRAKEIELQEGDRNTKYYHAKANGRKRKTTIFRLVQEEGVIEGQNNLKMYITAFYKKNIWTPRHNKH